MDSIYRSYYTKSYPIVEYMVKMLSVKPGMRVLEPCAGDGILVDALNNRINNITIDIYELNPEAVSRLNKKYRNNSNIRITEDDTLTSNDLLLYSNLGCIYDRIIANPPYGGWQEYEKRLLLKKIFRGFYVKETYTLFLYRSVQLLKEKGILVFIIPDTFMNLHMHTKLREYLLTNTKIIEIVLFPSSFFPGVCYGYSNMSIITLQKLSNKFDCLNNKIKVISGLKKVSELTKFNEGQHRIYFFSQIEVYENIDYAIFISDNPKVTYLINSSNTRIGNIAECVTGFYSGNDRKYLYRSSNNLKNRSKYKIIDEKLVCKNYYQKSDILQGINEPNCFIPILKGGGIKYYKPDMWFIDWSTTAVKNYKTNRKARFQNSKYYFKVGIGVPMVSSNRITASLIENKLFDQSIVGVFPNEDKFLLYLLAFFNSLACNLLIRTINPSTILSDTSNCNIY